MEWPPPSGEDGELFRDSDSIATLSQIYIDITRRRWVAELRTPFRPDNDHYTLHTWCKAFTVTVECVDPATIGPNTPVWPLIGGMILSEGDMLSTQLLFHGDNAPTTPMEGLLRPAEYTDDFDSDEANETTS